MTQQCPYCHKEIHKQGMMNHARACQRKNVPVVHLEAQPQQKLESVRDVVMRLPAKLEGLVERREVLKQQLEELNDEIDICERIIELAKPRSAHG